jgi:hypothetical protein
VNPSVARTTALKRSEDQDLAKALQESTQPWDFGGSALQEKHDAEYAAAIQLSQQQADAAAFGASFGAVSSVTPASTSHVAPRLPSSAATTAAVMPARKKSAVEVQKELGQVVSRTLASYKPTSSGDPPVPEFLQDTDLSYITQPANRPTTQYKSPIDCSIQNNPMNAAFTGETDDEAVLPSLRTSSSF